MRALCVIPARIGSTRLPNKPLQPIGGRPLVAFVAQRVLGFGLFREVVLATDNVAIANAVQDLDVEVVLTAATHRCGTERVAEVMAGRAGRFVAVGGFATYRGFIRPEDLKPSGLPVPVPEDFPLVANEAEQRFSWLMVRTEQAVMEAHPTAALFRYPYVYGPHQLVPREWSVIRRLLDGRRRIIVPDAGLALATHGYAENLAHAVLLAVDQPEASAGQIYNCGDDRQLSLAQIIELIAHTLDREVEIVDLPGPLARRAMPLVLAGAHHTLLDLTKIRRQLGYRDVVPADEALARTVRWYVEHPPVRGGEIEERLGDPFDYALEDRLMDRFQAAMVELEGIGDRHGGLQHHPYPHPNEAGLRRDHRNR